MKLIKKGLAVLLLALAVNARAQQGVQFTQYAFTGLTVNPAYAGYKEAWNINLVSRLQWTGIDGAPRTGAVSFDGVTDANRKNVGLGFVLTGDQLGPQSTASAYANYSYRLRLDDADSRRLCFGIGAGANVYAVDNGKFGASINDPSLTGTISKFSPDLRLGVYYYGPKFYAGASVLNLLADAAYKDAAVVRETRSYYFTAGYLAPLSAYVDFKPSILIKEDFKGPTNVDLSANFLLGKVLWLGATYRTGAFSIDKNLQQNLSKMDAVAAIAEFYINPDFRLGYSYDMSLNKLATYQNGTHELSLGFAFGRRRERVINPRYF